jgi:hypothetical protein
MIPCRGILANRHIGNIGGCPICSSSCEDIKHVLFSCERAIEVWKGIGVWDKIDEVRQLDRSGSVIVEEIIKQGGRLTHLDNVGFAELVLTAGWFIWWERRKKVHDEIVQSPGRSALSIIVLSRNYMIGARKPKAKQREGWKTPEEGKLKINVDAAFDENNGKGAIGVIIRDCNGQFVAGSQRFIAHIVDAPMAT